MQGLGKFLIIKLLLAVLCLPEAVEANNRRLNQQFIDCAGRYERTLGLPAGVILNALRRRAGSTNAQPARRTPTNSGFVIFFSGPLELGTPRQPAQAPTFDPRSGVERGQPPPRLHTQDRSEEARQEPLSARVPQDNNRVESPLGRPFAVIGPCNRDNRRSIICDNTNDFSIGMSLNLGENGRSGAGVSITIPLR